MAGWFWYSRHIASFPSRARRTPMNGAEAGTPVVVAVPTSSYSTTITSGSVVSWTTTLRQSSKRTGSEARPARVKASTTRRTIVDLLGLNLPDAVGSLDPAVARLLATAQEAGAVRADVRLPEVMALLTGVCQGAVTGGWDRDLRARTLAVVFAGLTAPAR
jgi:hypothetical protein